MDRELHGPDRSLDVRFADFMADDLGTVERFYTRAGVDLTDDIRARLRPGGGLRHARVHGPRSAWMPLQQD